MQKTIFRHLYIQVFLGMILGGFVGHYFPEQGINLKILAEGFIKLIRLMVAPIIFASVVVGLASLGDLKRVGRIGLKALIYFEVMTTLALIIGILVIKLFHPGEGVNADVSKLNPKEIETYVTKAHDQTVSGFFLNIIPKTIVGAFAEGDILQVLFVSVFFGIALASLGPATKPLVTALEQVYHALMKMIGMIVRLAPLAAFGSVAFTCSKFGAPAILSMGKVLLCMYFACLVFIIVGLGSLLRFCGISLWAFLKYIREEILIVLGTSSSEAAFPRMMDRMEGLGCSRPVVGIVLPSGYSFNLDGSAIYLTLGALYIAQATNTHLSLGQELVFLAVCLITSKGAAAVTGSGFIALAATLSAMHTIPVEGMMLIIGVDQLLSTARAVTNLIGNGTATIVVAKWEGEFDQAKARRALGG